jgi:hypothetical protein
MKSWRLCTLSSASVANRPGAAARTSGSHNRHCIVTAELRQSANEVEAADVLVAIVPNIVEGHEPIRPGAEYRLIQAQSLDDRVDVIGPKSRISVGVTGLVGEAMAAQVDGHKPKVGCQVGIQLPAPRQPTL